jgi:RNA-splicing ligase RtcB
METPTDAGCFAPLDLQGRCASARIFTTDLDQSARSQIQAFLDHPAAAGMRIRIMPDVHAGAGVVIGFTAQLGERLVPNMIGVDIGCGVAAWRLPAGSTDDPAAFDRLVRARIPAGRAIHREPPPAARECAGRSFATLRKDWQSVCVRISEDADRVAASLGTLGGGNHFIELDRDGSGSAWLVIHSGSRHFGLAVARHHQQLAEKRHGTKSGLEWLEGAEAEAYLEDMHTAQTYAALNRRTMAALLLGTARPPDVESVHNYIDPQDRVIRKGAIAARRDERVLVPLSMADGVILGRGLGNPDWNQSAPHGAGRRFSRSQAKATLSLEGFRTRMRTAGVYSTSIGPCTLDEAPEAYKDPQAILSALAPTVRVEECLRPYYSFKAGE